MNPETVQIRRTSVEINSVAILRHKAQVKVYLFEGYNHGTVVTIALHNGGGEFSSDSAGHGRRNVLRSYSRAENHVVLDDEDVTCEVSSMWHFAIFERGERSLFPMLDPDLHKFSSSCTLLHFSTFSTN